MKKVLLTMAALSMAAGALLAQNPAELYIVGTPNNWTTPNAGNLITLPATGDGIYSGEFDASGNLEFKIFTEKNDWSANNFWGGEKNNATISLLQGETKDVKIVEGSDSDNITVSNWSSTKATVTVNWNTKTVSISGNNQPSEVEPEKIPSYFYLVGTMNGWTPGNTTYKLEAVTPGVEYKGTFNLAAGTPEFKIFSEFATSWDDLNYYAGTSFKVYSDQSFSYTLGGKNGSNFACTNWEGGEMVITLNLANNTVTFEGPNQSALGGSEQPTTPAYYYLVGTMNDWTVGNTTYKLNAVTPGVEYKGTFNLAAGTPEFKIFSEFATSWNDNDYYAGESFEVYSDQDFTFTLGGKDGSNFACTNWKGGDMVITLNLANNAVTIAGADQPSYSGQTEETSQIYIIGNFQGWNINNGDYTLQAVDGKEGVYEATYNVGADDLYFRFYTELGNWDKNGLGSQVDDKNTTINFATGLYEGKCYNGKGNWNFNWKGGDLTFTVDTVNMTVKFRDPLVTGVAAVADEALNVTYSNGVVVAKDAMVEVYNLAGARVATAQDNCNVANLAKGAYIVKATRGAEKATVKIVK